MVRCKVANSSNEGKISKIATKTAKYNVANSNKE
jgi:hypothetical protein